MKKLGIGLAMSPGNMHQAVLMDFPVSMGGYEFTRTPDDPCVIVMIGCPYGKTEGAPRLEQYRESRQRMLTLQFKDYEAEIRRHLGGMFPQQSFNFDRDVESISVNRWAHGYAVGGPGDSTKTGRQAFGRITIANSDSAPGADAKTAMGKDPKADWSFWIAWYERVLAGRDFLPNDMAPILNELRKADWNKGPAHINPLFDGVLAKYRAQDIEVSGSDQVRLTSGTAQKIERTRVAMVAHRKSLPTTFDAILGFVTLEIERLQGLNYQNDDVRDEALRQIRVLTTIYETVGRLMPLVPTTDAMSLADAEKAEGLVQIYVTQIQEWPRNNAQELVDSTYRLALIGCVAAAAPMVGISASIAAVAGGAMFGGKKLIDSAKAAKDALGAGG